MENITIVLQRSELNYLIKYDTLRISSDRIINFSYNEFKLLSEKYKVHLLQNSLPIYEQDHEVLLIEYNSQLISYENAPTLEFKGILSIIPLTKIGSGLLSSKLNIDFNILSPLDEKIYKAFTDNRNHILRIEASRKLCLFYHVSMPKDTFIDDFQKATSFQLDDIKPKKTDSTLAHLVDFNVTPSFIPEGNIEALIKSACVGMKKVDVDVEKITQSAFYTFVIKEKEVINSETLFQAIKQIENKIELDAEGKEKFVKLTETLSDNGKYKNAFLLFSYFYYLKKVIEKNDYDVSVPKRDILELKYYDSDIASKVLFMLGYTFSIQTISKSIQSFSKSVLLKTRKNLDLEWAPKVLEQKDKENQFEKDNAKFEDDESVLFKNQIESSFEDEKAIEIQLSVENESEKNTFSMESKMNNELESTNMGVGLFSTKKELYNQVEVVSTFNFVQFKKNIGGGGKSEKLTEALKDRNIDEKNVSKELVISCLKEIGLYNNKGKVYDFAKKALKIFD